MNFIQAVAAARRVPVAPSGIVTSGLVLHYDPNETGGYSGSTVYDLVGSENILLNGGASVALPYVDLDGSNDYGLVMANYTPSVVRFGFSDSFTYSVWVNPKFINTSGFMIAIGSLESGSDFTSCGWVNGGTSSRLNMRFWLRQSASQYELITANTALTTNAPVYLTAVYSGSRTAGAWKIYLNASETTTSRAAAGSSLAAIDYTGATFAMGCRDSAVDAFWYGGIGAAHIYNRALSAAEILQNYNATKSDYGL